MEKILVVVDAKTKDTAAIEFACYLATLTHSGLTGFAVNHAPEAVAEHATITGSSKVDTLDFFTSRCYNHGLHYNVAHSSGNYLPEIIEESRFADLIVVDASTSVNGQAEGNLSHFVKELLQSSECPVVIAPFEFTGIDDIIFAYDHSSSAFFAFKQFTHLFPSLTNKKLTVAEVLKNERESAEYDDKLTGLIKQHYPSADYQLLKGLPSKELFSFLAGKKNSFLILGSYGRNKLSLLVEPSVSELIVKCINLPIFITHR